MSWEKLIVCFATVRCYCIGIRLEFSSTVYKMSSGSKDVIKKEVPAVEDANINTNQSEEYFESAESLNETVENNTSYASASLHDDSLNGQEKLVSVQSLHTENSPYAIDEEDPDVPANQRSATSASHFPGQQDEESSNTGNLTQRLANDESSSSDDSSQSSDDYYADAGERSSHSRAEKQSGEKSQSKRQLSKKATPVSENKQTATEAREYNKEIPIKVGRNLSEKRLREWRNVARWKKSIPRVHLIEHSEKLSTKSTTSDGEKPSGWKDGIPVFHSHEGKLSDGAETPDSFTGWENGLPVFPSFEGSIDSLSEEILKEETFYNDDGVPTSSPPRQEHSGSSTNVPKPFATKKVKVSQEKFPSRSTEFSVVESGESKEFSDAIDCVTSPPIQEERKRSPDKEFSDDFDSLSPQEDRAPAIPPIQEVRKHSPGKEFSDDFDSPTAQEERALATSPIQEHRRSPDKELSDDFDSLSPQEDRAPAIPPIQEVRKHSPGKEFSDDFDSPTSQQERALATSPIQEHRRSPDKEFSEDFDSLSPQEDRAPAIPSIQAEHKRSPSKDFSDARDSLTPQEDESPAITLIQEASEDSPSKEISESTDSLTPQDGVPAIPLIQTEHKGSPSKEFSDALDSLLSPEEDGAPTHPSIQEEHKGSPSKEFSDALDFLVEQDKQIPAFPLLTEDLKASPHEVGKKFSAEKQIDDSFTELEEVELSLPGEIKKKAVFDVVTTGETDQLLLLQTADKNAKQYPIKDQSKYAAYLVIVESQSDSEKTVCAESVEAAEHAGSLSGMNIEVLKWTEEGTPEIIRISAKSTQESVPLSRVVEQETVIRGRRRMLINVTCLKAIEETCSVEPEEPEIESVIPKQALGGIKDVTEDYIAADVALNYAEDEDEDVFFPSLSTISFEHLREGEEIAEVLGTHPQLEDDVKKPAEVMGAFPKLEDDVKIPAEVVGTFPKLEDDVKIPAEVMGAFPKLEDDVKKSAEVMGTFPKLEDDERKAGEALLMQGITVSRTKAEANYDEEMGIVEPGVVEKIIKTEYLSEVLFMEEYVDCESCPCGPCLCSGKVEVPGTCNETEKQSHTVGARIMEPIEALDDKAKGLCKMLDQCLCNPCMCSICDHKRNISVQTGGIYLIADDEEALDKDSNFLQVLNDNVVILQVKASVKDPELDSSSSPAKTAVISIRPVMVGPLTQPAHTSNEDDVGESVLKPVSTKAISFLMLLDENGKQQETMSDLKERVREELLQQDTGFRPIIEEWQTTMPDIKQTSESFVQGLVSMLPEILLAKGFCSMDTNEPTRTSATESKVMQKPGSFMKKESSFIFTDSPASPTADDGLDDTEKHQTYTNRESENPHTETGLSESDKVDENRLETGSKVIDPVTGQSESIASTPASELKPEEPNIEAKQSGSEEMVASSFKIGLSIREDLISSVLISNLESEEPNTETGKGTPDDLEEDSFIIGSTIIQDIVASISERTLKLNDSDTLTTSLSVNNAEAEVHEASGTLTEDAPAAAADPTEEQSKSSGDSTTSRRQFDNLEGSFVDDDDVYYDALDHFET